MLADSRYRGEYSVIFSVEHAISREERNQPISSNPAITCSSEKTTRNPIIAGVTPLHRLHCREGRGQDRRTVAWGEPGVIHGSKLTNSRIYRSHLSLNLVYPYCFTHTHSHCSLLSSSALIYLALVTSHPLSLHSIQSPSIYTWMKTPVLHCA